MIALGTRSRGRAVSSGRALPCPEAEALAEVDAIESVGGWWDRTSAHEYDVVGSGRDGVPVTVGSVKWRAQAPFDAHDLAELAAARSVLPKAGAARLLAVAPHGVAPGVEVDLALDAEQLIAALGSLTSATSHASATPPFPSLPRPGVRPRGCEGRRQWPERRAAGIVSGNSAHPPESPDWHLRLPETASVHARRPSSRRVH